MSAIHSLAVVNTASITSLVRMTLYHHSISVYQARIETSEGAAASGGAAPQGAAARCDNHEQPCVTDGPCSDSEREVP
jgi:hypothetical protein